MAILERKPSRGDEGENNEVKMSNDDVKENNDDIDDGKSESALIVLKGK